MQAEWNLSKLVKDLGGPARVQTLLLSEGMRPVHYRTLCHWGEGNSSPSHAVALIVALARRLDPSFDPMAYLITKACEDK